MIWPFKRKPRPDPLGDAERTTDGLKHELDELRRRLLDKTLERVADDDPE